MSKKRLIDSQINNYLVNSEYSKTDSNYDTYKSWKRNKSWLSMPTVFSYQQKVVILAAVFPDGNYIALSAGASSWYSVNWGDGTSTQDYSSNVVAYYKYNYSSISAETAAPCSFTQNSSIISRNSHGLVVGDTLEFYNISGVTNLKNGIQYYVVSADTNSFTISTTKNGSSIIVDKNGTADLLPYRQVLITITTPGNLTSINLFQKHSATGLVNAYSTPYLDIVISGSNLSSITISGTSTTVVNHAMLERVRILSMANNVSFTAASTPLFYNCTMLQEVEFNIPSNHVGNMDLSNMFFGCSALTFGPNISNFNKVYRISSMFAYCKNLISVPLYDTSNCQLVDSVFLACSSLRSIPKFNLQSATTLANAFSGCSRLEYIPDLNTPLITSLSATFQSCSSLRVAPNLVTSRVTTFANTFNNCTALVSTPSYDLISCTTITNIFQSCSSLKYVGELRNSRIVTNISYAINGCNSLIVDPQTYADNTSSTTSNFLSCKALSKINKANYYTNTGGTTISNTPSLTTIDLYSINGPFNVSSCKLGLTEINKIIRNLQPAFSSITTTKALTLTGNIGVSDSTSATYTCGYTVGSNVITTTNTAGISVGDSVVAANLVSLTARAATLVSNTDNTFYLAGHGYQNGCGISLAGAPHYKSGTGTGPTSSNWMTMASSGSRTVALPVAVTTSYITRDTGAGWVARTTLPISGVAWNSIAYGNNMFVATTNASGSSYAYSTDGLTWSTGTTPIATTQRYVKYLGNRFIMVSPGTNIVLVSTNGINWTQYSLPGIAGYFTVAYSLVNGQDMFILCNSTGNTVCRTSDFITFTIITLPVLATASWANSVGGSNGRFVLWPAPFTGDFYKMVSIDGGLTWYRRMGLNAPTNLTSASIDSTVATGNGLVVYGSSSGILYYSKDTDLESWDIVNFGSAVTSLVCYMPGEGKFTTLPTNGSTYADFILSSTFSSAQKYLEAYYVVNATADTFQLASTPGGLPIDFGFGVSNSTLPTLYHRPIVKVTAINPNVSVTISSQPLTTASFATSFRSINVSEAIAKNWTVTL